MSRSTSSTPVGQRIDAAMIARGTDTVTVARAAGMPVSDLEARLITGDFTMSDVVRVGGFLRMAPSDLFGAAA